MPIEPNPRNCQTCEYRSGAGVVYCVIALPKWADGTRAVDNPDDQCDSFRPIKGTFARICLNCGNPIRTHHKYSNLGDKQWIHKFCEHPESPSKWHYEKYGR